MSQQNGEFTNESATWTVGITGCGGESLSLLTGVEWAVERSDGQEVVEGSTPSLSFDAEGNVYGQGSYNRYRGGYKLTGEGLTMGPFATTMMACPQPLMEQEQRFLEVLARVQGFEAHAGGTLSLRTADGRTIGARRG